MGLRNWYHDKQTPARGSRSTSMSPQASRPLVSATIRNPGVQGSMIPHQGVPPQAFAHPDILSANAAQKSFRAGPEAFKSLPQGVIPSRAPRTRFYDPLSLMYATGYKDRRFSISYDALRRVSYQLGLISAIITTRVNQVASFAQPYRENKQVGFHVRFKDDSRLPTESEKMAFRRLEQMVLECGFGSNPYTKIPREGFRDFLKKIVRDSLVFDQLCLMPGTWIELADGTGIPVEDIEGGMKVRTHTGQVREVLHRTARLYTGEMIRLKVRGQTIEATPGHPFLISKRSSLKGNKVELHDPEWIVASDISLEDYITYPRPKLEEDENLVIRVFGKTPRKYPTGDLEAVARQAGVHRQTAYQILAGFYKKEGDAVERVLRIAEEQGVRLEAKRIHEEETKLTSNWGRFLGLYVAEGHVQASTVRLTFHQDRVDLKDFVCNFAESLGITASIVECEERQGVTVMLSCKVLADFLVENCSTGSSQKRVPSFLFCATREIKDAFLYGYLEGDGHFGSSYASYNTTSRNLFTGLRVLFADRGIYVGETKIKPFRENWSEQYGGRISGSAYHAFAEACGFPVVKKNKAVRMYICDEHYLYVKVGELSRFRVKDQPVFNMEVEEDHSYIAEGICSHNCFEIIPDTKGRPYEFRGVDASTIRLASTYDGRKPYEKGKPFRADQFSERWKKVYGREYEEEMQKIHTVQVMHGRIENIYTFYDMAFALRNPRSDIWVNGYGFCLHPETMVTTTQGMIPVEKLVQREFEVQLGSWHLPAFAFKTQKRPVYELEFTDGRKIKASPEHRFYVLDEKGFFDWKELKDVRPNDVVACDCEPIEGGIPCGRFEFEKDPSNKHGNPKPWVLENADSDLWEVVGWMCGDGHFRVRCLNSCEFALCYDSSEGWIAQKHLAILEKYGLPTPLYEREDGLLEIKFCHMGFTTWLKQEVGKPPTMKGVKANQLPGRVFTLPKEDRIAFLRGLFSADGHRGASDTPHIGGTDEGLQADTQRLLWTLGIRSKWTHGRIHKTINDVKYEYSGEYDDGKLWVYDKVPFYEMIGFMQPHKQPILSNYQGTRADVVGKSFGKRCAQVMKNEGVVDRRIRGLLEEPPRWGVTRSWLRNKMISNDMDPHGFFPELRWHHGFVKSVVDLHEEVEMYDLSVDDEFHGFVAEGAIVHNSEIEQSLQSVLGMIWGETYNRKIFCVFNGLVNTKAGLIRIEDLYEEYKDDVFEIYNGQQYVAAKVFQTGHRDVVRTKLWNGLEIKTSPEHRFYVIPRESEDGQPEWRKQKELKQGDFALVGYHRSEGHLFDDEERAKRKLHIRDYETNVNWGRNWYPKLEMLKDPAFWEMIGFALGDGHWSGVFMGEGKIQVFPHHTRDQELFEPFLNTIEKYGIHGHQATVAKSRECSDGEYGYPYIHINHKEFVRWMLDLGFRPSSEGKRIPDILYQMPAYVREALLRGIFSADGHSHKHCTGYKTPTTHSSDDRLRQDILMCLWSVGVAANESGKGWGQSRKGEIRVQDIGAFVERVGYLQTYKNEGIERSEKSKDRWDQLHPSLCVEIAKKFQSHPKWSEVLSKNERCVVNRVARGGSRMSRPRAIQLLKRFSLEIPRSLNFCQVPIDVLDIEAVDTEIMHDLEVFNEEHLWLANHIAVHNSQGSNPKGIISIKGDDISPEQLESFRRQWHSQVAGVENCIDGGTRICTENDGLVRIDEFLGNLEEKEARIWAGDAFVDGLVYRTKEPKNLCMTMLSCNAFLQTSPDHKFRVIEDGELVWKRQRNLTLGTRVVVDNKFLGDSFNHPRRIKTSRPPLPSEDFDESVGLHFSRVTALEWSNRKVPMFDVSMNRPDHLFVGDGVILSNSWRTPILQAESVQYQSFQQTNREMEFSKWLAYLSRIVCSVFQIDPVEVYVEDSGGATGRTPMFESKNEWKIKHSKDKGLRPLLKFVASVLNKYIIDPLDSTLMLDFVGLDELTEPDRVELIQKKCTTFKTVNEVRAEEGLDPIPGGNIVMNAMYVQAYQLEKQMQPGYDQELNPWTTTGDGVPLDYGESPAVPLYLQAGHDMSPKPAMPGMPPGGKQPPGGVMPPPPMGGGGMPPGGAGAPPQ